MTLKMIQGELRFGVFMLLLGVCILVLFGWACTAPPKKKIKTETASRQYKAENKIPEPVTKNARVPDGPTIEIKKNTPSDTVRVFYDRLRKNMFREALVLTNLRPAVDGLNDTELRDLGVDFRKIAGQVPERMPINGEIVSGKTATVTVGMPNEKDGKLEVHELRLRKEKGHWVLLVADPEGEKRVRKEGKNYFFSLRMEVHHEEAKAMLNRIAKAQAVYSSQNDGVFGDLKTLVQMGYVPADALTVETTGYNYAVTLSFDGRTYTALATPAEYGKSGKLSFALRIRRGIEPRLISKDTGGKTLES